MSLSAANKIVDVRIDGCNVRLNVLQPLPLKWIYDDEPSKYSESALIAKFCQSSASAVAMPKTNFRVVQRANLKPFERSQFFITYQPKSAAELDEIVEYEVDEEDLEFLEIINEKFDAIGAPKLSEATFEAIIDRLEKESFFQCGKSGALNRSMDDDAVCCVCNDGEVTDMNMIIFCDMCNIPVHQDCYGVPYVPDGLWLCRKCQVSPSEPVECALCPLQYGAFKQTVDSRWAHVVCTLWLNEVHFENTVFMEPINGVNESLRKRCKLRCLVCKQKKGACFQCSKKSCTRSFHVTCARAANMDMRVSLSVKRGTTTVHYMAFCHYHSEDFLRKNGDITDPGKLKRRVEEELKQAREKLEVSRESLPPCSVPTVSLKVLSKIASKLHVDDRVMERVVAYWSLKRKSICGAPLIKRLIQHNKQSSQADSVLYDDNPPSEFSLSVDEKVKEEIQMLRQNLERVRLLCELVKKREKLKLQCMETWKDVACLCTKPVDLLLREVLDSIVNKDRSNVFANPVSEKEVPGYSSIITKPMDLSIIKRKVERMEYKNLAQMKADFSLMINNCSKFNRHNKFFWKYGMRLQRSGMKIFKAAETEEAFATLLSNEEISQVCSSRSKVKEEEVVVKRESPDSDQDPSPAPSKSHPRAGRPSSVSARRKSQSMRKRPAQQSPSRERKVFKNSKGAPQRQRVDEGKRVHSHNDLPPRNYRSSAYSSFRSIESGGSALNSPTENSMDESSSAAEDSRSYAHSSSRRRRVVSRSAAASSSHPDTVEIGFDFQHNDIVWVQDHNGRSVAVGRVIDLCMKVLLDDFPVDEMINEQPKDPSTHFTLVLLFDKNRTWRWFPSKRLAHCDPLTETSSPSSAIQAALSEARAFRRYLHK